MKLYFGETRDTCNILCTVMRGSTKFCQRGSNSYNVLAIRGERIQIPLKTGHLVLASKTPFKWRFTGGPIVANIECWLSSFVIFQGIPTSIAKKPYIFAIFSRGPDTLPPPTLDLSMTVAEFVVNKKCNLAMRHA